MVPKVSQGAFTAGLLGLFAQEALFIGEGLHLQKTLKCPQIHCYASSPSFLNRSLIFNSVFY